MPSALKCSACALVNLGTIVVAAVFAKKTQATPKSVIAACKRRLRAYDAIAGEKE